MSKRFLVTGGFGFIGSHFVERLLATGAEVHVVDDLSTSPINLQAYLDQLKHRSMLTYDICTDLEYCNGVGEERYDGIFHLASVVGPVGILQHAGRIAREMIIAMSAVAELALRCGAKVVDVSTSEVYGGGRDGWCSEDDTKLIQSNVTVRLEYAVGKLAAETALVNLTKVTDLQASIVRPFNVAGPRQSPQGGFVLPRFIDQGLSGEPLTVYNDGTMVRALTHVYDIVNGLLLTMESGESGSAYNIGNPANKTTILDLAKRVIRISKSSSEIIFVDPTTLFGPLFAEANDKYPDASLALRALGWIPRYDLDVLIADTVEYTKKAGRPSMVEVS